MNTSKILLPDEITKILNVLVTTNIIPIIVGGYVRDFFLKIPSKDIDIELYNVDSLESIMIVLKAFGDVNMVGKSFGVIKLSTKNFEIDFSLPRTESKIGHKHTDFTITTHKNISFKEASSRRDFTINAMGYDFYHDKILDPFNGQKDLENRTLDIIYHDRFIEDPLRILRAVQFCARFELTPTQRLLQLCQKMILNKELQYLPKSRIVSEFKKLFLKASMPSIGLTILNKIYHDSLYSSEICNAVDRLCTLKVNSYSLFITLISIMIEKESYLENYIEGKKSYHDSLELYKYFEKIKNISSDYELKKLSCLVKLKDAIDLYKAQYKSTNYILELENRAKVLNILERAPQKIIEGRDLIILGLTPSKEFSVILKVIYDAQLKEEFLTHKEGLEWSKKYLESL